MHARTHAHLHVSELIEFHIVVVHRVPDKNAVCDRSAMPNVDPTSVMLPPTDVGRFRGWTSLMTGASKLQGSRAVPTNADTVITRLELKESSEDVTRHRTLVLVVHAAVMHVSDQSRLTVEEKSELAKFKPESVIL
jgi:hypothetical protein